MIAVKPSQVRIGNVVYTSDGPLLVNDSIPDDAHAQHIIQTLSANGEDWNMYFSYRRQEIVWIERAIDIVHMEPEDLRLRRKLYPESMPLIPFLDNTYIYVSNFNKFDIKPIDNMHWGVWMDGDNRLNDDSMDFIDAVRCVWRKVRAFQE